MATSNSVNFNETRDQIIQDALELLNVVDAGGIIQSTDTDRGIRSLNQLMKAWQAEGIKLWNKKQAAIFLQKSQASYILGATDHAALVSDYQTTTTTAAAVLGASTIDVTSATGMAISDNIGIELDDGTRQWTTITNISSLTLTLNTTLTAAAASGVTVITYTTKLNRPLQITSARVLDLDANSERITDMISYADYFDIPNKVATGTPNQVMYDRSMITTGTAYVWPIPDGVTNILRISISELIEDFDASTDDPDVPQEWLLALSYNLAVYMAPFYGKYTELPAIKALADELKHNVLWYDNEISALSFEPDFTR